MIILDYNPKNRISILDSILIKQRNVEAMREIESLHTTTTVIVAAGVNH